MSEKPTYRIPVKYFGGPLHGLREVIEMTDPDPKDEPYFRRMFHSLESGVPRVYLYKSEPYSMILKLAKKGRRKWDGTIRWDEPDAIDWADPAIAPSYDPAPIDWTSSALSPAMEESKPFAPDPRGRPDLRLPIPRWNEALPE